MRGFGQSSTSQQEGRGHTKDTLIHQDAQASNAVVVGTLSVCFIDARILLDPGATHSFVSPVFASKSGWQASRMTIHLSIAAPLSDSLDIDVVLQGCPVLIEGRELLADLVLLDVVDFDVILGIYWLSQHYATIDYHRKEAIFRILNNEDFKFVDDKSSAP